MGIFSQRLLSNWKWTHKVCAPLLWTTNSIWFGVVINYDTPYYYRISLTRVIEADISVAVVLISMGALLGRTTPIQLLLMSIIEIVVYAANEYLQLKLLKVCYVRIIIKLFDRSIGGQHLATTIDHTTNTCY